MTIVRPVVEASVAGLVGAGVMVDNVVDIAQQVTGPGVVFGAEAAWQWALVISAGVLVWRAGALVRGVEGTLQNFAEKHADSVAKQREVDERLIQRIESNEKKWREWEPMLIEWKVRYKLDGRDLA